MCVCISFNQCNINFDIENDISTPTTTVLFNNRFFNKKILGELLTDWM